MTFLHIILVALTQGITEFLPVSSSGHLILLPKLTGTTDQGQFIDVAVHVGTLGAVILYFRRDVALALRGTPDALAGRLDAPGARLALGLMIATIPIIFVGAILHFTGLSDALRSIKVIAWTMLGFGLVLYWADRTGGNVKQVGDWTLRDAVIMGLWQVLALIPGTSRSGITITGARLLGFGREDGARLAMLMSIPTIAASGILLSADAAISADAESIHNGMLAAGLSFLSALAALALMMRFLRSVSFTPYVIYRVILGLVLLAIAYG
ncbi:undecaprenyl-diphosphate phosphatase [Ruegeria sp. 2205SS24-7]|uniref:undecaprenyl-diphosphate phosphatase n=1 Tax=Ruegeria discodermiae TaxID=3064389 RepID=UPI002741CDBF|nr:undecaprenyl-diphosphate phosphatase [Ruegeria sp. 2205SS24-7]MDP5220036.1 undecaprenyl-diphosphate phosphatase [Ruegeria sp. 2205SS24-7]